MIDGDRMRFGILVSLLGVAVAGATLDFGEHAPWTTILYAATCLGVLVRAVPPDRLPLATRVAAEAVCVVSAGIVFGLQPNAGLGVLLYLSAVYVGAMYPQRISIPLAVLLGGAVAAADLLGGPHDINEVWIGVSMTFTVWAGIARRTRRERTRALERLVEQTTLTAASEARSSALAERARIARELHDLLAHTLSGAGMQLELADALLEAERPADARDAVHRARAAIAGGVTEARDAVRALREDTVDLPAALTALAEGPGETVSVAPVDLDDAASLAVLRVAQEAITNARRHAPGSSVTVRLEPIPDGAELTVTNGPGREAVPSPGSGLGLIGMRERASESGGALRAGPDGAGGWCVTLTVPTKEARA